MGLGNAIVGRCPMNSSAPCVVAIDVGTSAVRTALIASNGSLLRTHRRQRDEPGDRAFNAAALWDEVAAGIRALEPDDAEVAAIGVAAHIGSVLTDDAFRPVLPGTGWASTAGVNLLPPFDWDRALRTGRPCYTGGLLPALLDAKEHQPEAFRRVRWALSPVGYLVGRLTGVASADHVSAAYTLASDVRRRAWDSAIISATGIDSGLFPEQRPSIAVVGELSDAASRLSGLPAGTPVVAGGPDGTIGAVAAIGTDTSLVADIAGTTDVLVMACAEAPCPARPVVVNPYADPSMWTIGGPTGSTGGAHAEWARLLGLDGATAEFASVEQRVADSPVGARGLFVQPELTGRRFPRWEPDARGTLTGLGDRHSAGDVMRAVVEATAFVVREAIETVDQGSSDVVLAGGVARSAVLAQLRADVLARDVLTCQQPDMSLVGAALVAAVGGGVHPDMGTAHAVMGARTRRVRPDPARAETYQGVYAEWLARR